MADYNIQQKTLNSGGTYDNLYPKSKAGLVDIADTAGHFIYRRGGGISRNCRTNQHY